MSFGIDGEAGGGLAWSERPISLDLKGGGIDLGDVAFVIDIDVNVARVVAHCELWNTAKLNIPHDLSSGRIDHGHGLAGFMAHEDASGGLVVDLSRPVSLL
jgi:hypothetical protein